MVADEMNGKMSRKIKTVEEEIKSVTIKNQVEDIGKEILSMKEIK